jgi:multisubunit Na+/H+ antiporter MnhB subunit
MCVGGVALYLLIFSFAPAWFGYSNPRHAYPELTLLATAVMLTVPMALWMRLRGMEWRPVLEMSGAAFAMAVGIIVLGRLGILSTADVEEFAGLSFCGPACVAMFVAMLFRYEMYAGRLGHGHGRART